MGPLWRDWQLFWLQQTKYPIHIIRYEDLRNDPEPTLKAALAFALDVEDISGTRIEKYIKNYLT